MTVMGTWEVTIARRDGSEHHVRELHGRAPRRGEEIEIEDATGHTPHARIDSFHHDLPKQAGLGIWQISATEI